MAKILKFDPNTYFEKDHYEPDIEFNSLSPEEKDAVLAKEAQKFAGRTWDSLTPEEWEDVMA